MVKDKISRHMLRCISAVALICSIAISGCTKEWFPVPEAETGNAQGGQSSDGNGEDSAEEEQVTWTEVSENVSISETKVITQNSDTFLRGYWPDGKLIPVRKGNQWQLFWGESTDALTVAGTPFPEDHAQYLTDDSKIWGKDFSRIDGFNDGGSWFIGIFPLDDSGHYVGFFHAESHWDNSGIAHKSIGVVYSDDYGATWRDPQPIITDAKAKPANPDWTGLGDGCVIWDGTNSRYICYYQGKIASGANALCMAASSDRNGAPGTWKKWDGSDFTLPACDQTTGLGGENIPIAGLSGVTGANPSVMWNTFLGKWVMAYASWSKVVYMSFSSDGITWTSPEQITGNPTSPACYPNLISEDGDLEGGETVQLYWSHNQNSMTGIRDLAYAKIRFKK